MEIKKKGVIHNIRAFERSPYYHISKWTAAIITFFSVVFACYQISIDLDDRRAERKDREAERRDREQAAIVRAWDKIMLPIGGNTGKGSALNFLIQKEQPFYRVMIDCQHNGTWDSATNTCKKKPIFDSVLFKSGFFVNQPEFEETIISNSNFDGRHYINCKYLKNTDLFKVEFRDIKMSCTEDQWVFHKKFPYSDIEISDTSFSEIAIGSIPYFSNITGSEIKISGESYDTLRDMLEKLVKYKRADARINFAWAWADFPPIFTVDRVGVDEASTSYKRNFQPVFGKEAIHAIQLCDPDIRRPSTLEEDKTALQGTLPWSNLVDFSDINIPRTLDPAIHAEYARGKLASLAKFHHDGNVSLAAYETPNWSFCRSLSVEEASQRWRDKYQIYLD